MITKKRLGILLAFVIAVGLPALALAGDYPCATDEAILYAGQDLEVGTVSVEESAGNLIVTYKLSDDAAAEGWLIMETHLAVEASLPAIPQTRSANPIPGLFEKGDCFAEGVTEASYCFSLDTFEDCDALFIAAHAVVERQEGDAVISETAWADGCRFTQRGNWATYFIYILDGGLLLL